MSTDIPEASSIAINCTALWEGYRGDLLDAVMAAGVSFRANGGPDSGKAWLHVFATDAEFMSGVSVPVEVDLETFDTGMAEELLPEAIRSATAAYLADNPGGQDDYLGYLVFFSQDNVSGVSKPVHVLLSEFQAEKD